MSILGDTLPHTRGSPARGPRPRGRLRLPLARVLACVGLLVTASYAQAPQAHEAFSTAGSGWEGYSEFVRLAQRQLGMKRVKPVHALDYSALRTHDAIIIANPTRPLDDASLSAFLADGGRLALLDDFGEGGTFLEKFSIFRIAPPGDPKDKLRNNPELPIATPALFQVAGAEVGRHPISQNVEAVMTNHPMGLRHPNLTRVLEIPSQSGPSTALGVTGVISGKGRLFALGDPSIFINLMLRYPGNRAFAEGLVRYLGAREPADSTEDATRETQPRGLGTVYIATGAFEQVGHYGKSENVWDEFERKLSALRSALARVGEEGLPPYMATALATLLAFAILITQLSSTLRIPRLFTPGFARTPPLAAQTGISARAHVLGAETTNSVLALLELDAALRETITHRLKDDPGPLDRALAERLQRAGVSKESASDTDALLRELGAYGQSLVQGKPRRATEKDLKRLHERARLRLSEIERI